MTPDLTPTPVTVPPMNTSSKGRISHRIIWLLLWPIIIGTIAIATLFGLSFVLSGWMTGGADGPQGFHTRGYMAIFITILVIACLIFIRLQSRAKSTFQKRSATVLRGYMWFGILLGAFLLVIIPDPQTITANAGIDVQQASSLTPPALASDPTISSILITIGAKDTANIETKFVSGYSTPGRLGEYQAFLDSTGKWSYGVLSAKQGTSGNDLTSIIAHEYLHHIWFRSIDEPTREKLTSDLIAMYGNDELMHRQVESYADTQTLQPTELFSYYCTGSSDTYLSSYVLSECNKYINRSALQFAR